MPYSDVVTRSTQGHRNVQPELLFFGLPQIRAAGTLVEWPTSKLLAIIAYLAHGELRASLKSGADDQVTYVQNLELIIAFLKTRFQEPESQPESRRNT
jgi:hypothetical protein